MHVYGMLRSQTDHSSGRRPKHASHSSGRRPKAQVVARPSQSAAPMADKKRKLLPDTDAHLGFTYQPGHLHYRCKQCNTLFRDINEARDHVVTHDATLQANLQEYRMKKPLLSCNVCDKTFRDCPTGRAQLSKHQKCCGRTIPRISCNRCGRE